MIRRDLIPGKPGIQITMPDGLIFTSFVDCETDAELEEVARMIREYDAAPQAEPDEDAADDGYGWERRALNRVAL